MDSLGFQIYFSMILLILSNRMECSNVKQTNSITNTCYFPSKMMSLPVFFLFIIQKANWIKCF